MGGGGADMIRVVLGRTGSSLAVRCVCGVGVCETGSRRAVGFQPCVCEKLAEVRPGWQTSQVSVCVCVCV